MTGHMPYDGHPCPMEVTFDIAEEQLVGRGIPEEAALALRTVRACLRAARERYGCKEAVVVEGQPVCPLETISMHARSIAANVLALHAEVGPDGALPADSVDGGPMDSGRHGSGPYL